ncbi:circadian clock KaiB family protein [Desulfopila sp. IMCC35008]|uniref:circadian clock KaiB family protein n=1 Tax=Desulfopila sp. IMCC35008 TaxID=2653858 RepID=UPI0013D34598|nr:circadian clock KaiB family protein [Desulfopila sp. IMCC35008]
MAKSQTEVSGTSETWKFILYKGGSSLMSRQAEKNLRDLLEKYLHDQFTLEVIDIMADIEAVPPDILAVPTVVRMYPCPERRVLGNLSETDKAVSGLGLGEQLF